MKPLQDSTSLGSTSLVQIRRIFLGILSLAVLASSTMVAAQDFNQPDSADTPWSVTSSAPYIADPSFNDGLYLAEPYTGPTANSQLGRKIARLSNGDVVAAGLASKFDGALGNLPINLLLTRYNTAGQRVAWTNPGVNGHQFNLWVVFPNTNDPAFATAIKDVLDIKVFGDRIFVLVDRRFQGGNDIDSYIYVFGTDGAFVTTMCVACTGLSEYSGGMDFRSSLTFPETITVGVTASTFNGVWRPTFRSGTLNANGTITFNPVVFPNPGNYCPTNRGCILRSIALGGRNGQGAGTKFYLAGTRQSNIPDDNAWDFLVMAVNFDGSPVNSFGGSGVTTVPFDDGGDDYDDAHSINVSTSFFGSSPDSIYVTGFVDRTCKDGFGVVKLNDTGGLDHSFGSFDSVLGHTGKLIIGGAKPPPGSNCSVFFSTSASYANDAVLDGGKLAIAGFTVYPPGVFCIPGNPCPEDDIDGMISVIDTAHGDIESFRTYSYTDTVNGSRSRHSGFWGIAATINGSFTATGDVRFFQTAAGQPSGAQQFGTLRVSSDRIFANGFEN